MANREEADRFREAAQAIVENARKAVRETVVNVVPIGLDALLFADPFPYEYGNYVNSHTIALGDASGPRETVWESPLRPDVIVQDPNNRLPPPSPSGAEVRAALSTFDPSDAGRSSIWFRNDLFYAEDVEEVYGYHVYRNAEDTVRVAMAASEMILERSLEEL